ncbi:hypothetical protein N752_20145 [Desulforamulus aquiferis]|nr:ATP-binding protein [Desulforamulus aquiferis]RYD03369.1 hypothetical protein N752_20145 [Desulforamulus aquiferis]
MIENVLDNHLRYAKTTMVIRLTKDIGSVNLYFWNDGVEIEPHTLEQIFSPFNKGREGKTGLGLAIVQRILKINRGTIELNNENNGVSTRIKLPS